MSTSHFYYQSVLLKRGIVVILLYLLCSCCSNPGSEIFDTVTPTLIKQLKQEKKKLIVIIGNDECGVCKNVIPTLKQTPQLFNYITNNAFICYINSNQGEPQHAIKNSLFQVSYPMIYIFDENLHMFSCIANMTDIINSIPQALKTPNLTGLRDYSTIGTPFNETHTQFQQIKKENVKAMLENSFAGYIYLKEDAEKSCEYLYHSLNQGEFFYNNYLMYKCQRLLNDSLKQEKYKIKALQFQSGLEWFLYEKELLELGATAPENFIIYKKELAERRKQLQKLTQTQ